MEPGCAESLYIGLDRGRTHDAFRPELRMRATCLGWKAFDHDVRKLEAPTGLQYSRDLADRPRLVRHEVEARSPG